MNDIIKDFHELTEIPVFQEMVPDKKYMDTEEHLDVLQMNIGRKCNLLCKHCHVNAGPARTEEMSKEVMDACLTFAKEHCNDRYYRRCTRDESTSGISDRRKQ